MIKKLIAVFLLFALAACAGEGDSDSDKKDSQDKKPKKEEFKTDNLICPQVAILQQAQEVIDYGSKLSNAENFAVRTRMKQVAGDCAYQDNGIDIKFDLTVVSEAGARLKKSQISLPYFIAIVDPNDTIVSRKMMSVSFDLEKNKLQENSEPLHVFIPLAKSALISGPDYRVLVGFDMSRQQAPSGGLR